MRSEASVNTDGLERDFVLSAERTQGISNTAHASRCTQVAHAEAPNKMTLTSKKKRHSKENIKILEKNQR